MRNIIKRLDRAIINSKLIVPVPAQSLVLWSTNDYKAPSYRFQHQYSHGHVGMLSRRDLNWFWHVVQYWPFHKYTNLIQGFKKEQTTMNVNVGDLIFAWASMFGPTPLGLLFADSIKSNVIRKKFNYEQISVLYPVTIKIIGTVHIRDLYCQFVLYMATRNVNQSG